MSFAARHRTGLEFGAVLLALAILAGIVYEPQAINGGFLSDAWANRASWVFNPESGFFARIGVLGEQSNIAPRPLQAVYLALLNTFFGGHSGFWLTWQVATNVAMCAVFYLLLRKLGFRLSDAAMIALLVLVFPAASSTRFWLATIWAPASLGMVCLGFLLALYAFETQSRRNRLLLHGLSLLLYVASLLLYEIALLVILAGVLLYLLRAPWRDALARWSIDVIVLAILTLTVTLASDDGHEESTVGAWIHGRTILSQAKTLFVTDVLPFASDKWYVILLLLLVPAAALVVWRLSEKADPVRRELQRWLLTIVAGLVIVVLGYVIYAPGTDYYLPLNPGIGNRINVVPSFGWVLILYAGAMICATLVLRGVPRARAWTSPAAAIGCVLIAAGWLGSISNESAAFTKAHEEDERVLATIERSIPNPRPNSTIWTFAQPVEVILFVPVFGNTWDMTASVQLRYDDGTLRSLVAYPETNFKCGPDAVIPAGRYSETGRPNRRWASPYGLTYFVNTTSGEWAEINSRSQCEGAVAHFPEAPLLPPPAP